MYILFTILSKLYIQPDFHLHYSLYKLPTHKFYKWCALNSILVFYLFTRLSNPLKKTLAQFPAKRTTVYLFDVLCRLLIAYPFYIENERGYGIFEKSKKNFIKVAFDSMNFFNHLPPFLSYIRGFFFIGSELLLFGVRYKIALIQNNLYALHFFL